MGVLGGGGSYAVAGMRVWSNQTALIAVTGSGFPDAARQQLNTITNMGGLVTRSVPQPRFWQLFEADGTRHEVPRTDFEVFQQIPVRPEELPAFAAQARGAYLQTATAGQIKTWAVYLRSLNPEIVILWEPWEIFYEPERLVELKPVAQHVNIICPQTVELSWMLDETEPDQQLEQLLGCGFECVALRLGSIGSLVGASTIRRHIESVPVTVVDETGAGNAYGGGFVVGYVESGGDPVTAGRYGAVAASFALTQAGLPALTDRVRAEAEARLRLIP